MYLLKKVFQLREKVDDEAEKPFLEHLEDLRITMTRITLALLISTVGCFIFRNDLMEIIRKPVTQVWEARQADSLKNLDTKIEVETWEHAKRAARDIVHLSPEQKDLYFAKASGDVEDLRFHAQSVVYYRAARAIPDEKMQAEFVEEFPGIDDRMRKQLKTLLEGQPEAAVDARGKMVLMQALNPTEGFMLSIKLAFFAGIVISFPFLLYFILQFVLPGLHRTERKALFPALAVGFGLFLLGVFFAYFYVLPRVLEFFYNYSAQMGIENEWRIGYYISFATQFTLIFGLAFELPVVVMTLVKLGILGYDTMKRTRSYAILAMFVIAAIITPTPDAFTLCLLAVPMIILYEICIWLAYFINKKERQQEEEEEKERMERLLAAGPAAAPGTEALDDPEGGEPDPHHEGDEDGENPYHYEDEYGSDDDYGSDYDYGQEGLEHDEDGVPVETDPGAVEGAEGGEGGEGGEGKEGGEAELKDGDAAWRKTLGSEVPEPEGAEDVPPGEASDGTQAEGAEEDAGEAEPPAGEIQPEFELDEPDPGATEEGEEEDVSDPWDEEEGK